MPRSPKIALLESYAGRASPLGSTPYLGLMTSMAAERYGDPIHAGELHGEIMATDSPGCADAAAWVECLFDHPTCMQLSGSSEVQRAHSLAECDAVLLCTSDIATLKALIERIQRIAPGAAIFTVTEKLSPHQQAMVLGWGADDVLDLSMATREGAARVRAVCRRIALTQAARRTH